MEFYASARLAEAFATTGQTELAISVWISAFDRAKYLLPHQQRFIPQFTASSKGLVGVRDAEAQKNLWIKLIDAVRIGWAPPYNCLALSALAAELYKQGNFKKADAVWYHEKAAAVWEDAIQAAREFSRAPRPPRRTIIDKGPGEPPRTVPPPPRTPRLPIIIDEPDLPTREPRRTKQGLIIELPYHFNVMYERARTLLNIGLHMYAVGKGKEARRIWGEALAEGAKIEAPLPPPPPPLPGPKIEADVPPPPPLPPPLFWQFGQLLFYNAAAEALYRQGEFGLQKKAEQAILELTKKKINPAPERARVLIDSAGRLHDKKKRSENGGLKGGKEPRKKFLRDSGSIRVWNEALIAAGELEDAAESEREPSLFSEVPEPSPISAQSEELRTIQSILSKKEFRARSFVFEAVAGMLFRLGAVQPALQAARAIMDKQWQTTALFNAAEELLKRNEVNATKLIIDELWRQFHTTRDEQLRWSQITSALELQNRLGLFRQSRWDCRNCTSSLKLWNSTQILWRYEVRHNLRNCVECFDNIMAPETTPRH